MRIGAGRWKNAELPLAGDDVRPVPGRLRTSLFSILLPRLEGAVVLDLCAGVGGFGLEAVSRGAARAVLVDRDRATAKALADWVAARKASDVVTVVNADATRGGWPEGPYDLVFLDPPFSVWASEAEARAFLGAAAEALAVDGVAAVKCPERAVFPADSRWRVVDRRTQGGVSYALLARPAPLAPPAPPDGSPGGIMPTMPQRAPKVPKSVEPASSADAGRPITMMPRQESLEPERRPRRSGATVRPAHDRKESPRGEKRKKSAPQAPSAPDAIVPGQGPPRPIGPEALKALREAIKSGKYPSDQAVIRGLVRMIRKP